MSRLRKNSVSRINHSMLMEISIKSWISWKKCNRDQLKCMLKPEQLVFEGAYGFSLYPNTGLPVFRLIWDSSNDNLCAHTINPVGYFLVRQLVISNKLKSISIQSEYSVEQSDTALPPSLLK